MFYVSLIFFSFSLVCITLMIEEGFRKKHFSTDTFVISAIHGVCLIGNLILIILRFES